MIHNSTASVLHSCTNSFICDIRQQLGWVEIRTLRPQRSAGLVQDVLPHFGVIGMSGQNLGQEGTMELK